MEELEREKMRELIIESAKWQIDYGYILANKDAIKKMRTYMRGTDEELAEKLASMYGEEDKLYIKPMTREQAIKEDETRRKAELKAEEEKREQRRLERERKEKELEERWKTIKERGAYFYVDYLHFKKIEDGEENYFYNDTTHYVKKGDVITLLQEKNRSYDNDGAWWTGKEMIVKVIDLIWEEVIREWKIIFEKMEDKK